ncbi:MAG: hypothetical protein QOJ80_5292 [Mycobacterium sp.]|nr:hypothetical protein [Mycobacterium sp.]
MSSPNEPGPPRTGDGAGGTNGSGNGTGDGRPGPVGFSTPGEHVDVPPWQRGTPRARPPRGSDAPSHPEGGRAGTAAGHSPGGADARLNRFISGGPAGQAAPVQPSGSSGAPAREPDVAPSAGRSESVRPETYASELPDLSGSSRQSPRKSTGDRTTVEPSTRPPSTRAGSASRQAGPVRASMQIRRLDPWSVLKVSLVLSVASFFVWMIAVAFLYLVLGGMGVWSKLNSNVGDLLTSSGGSGGELVSSGTIFGGAALIGLVNIVLLTAMATCGAFIYNLTTDLVGGVEVTLADRD